MNKRGEFFLIAAVVIVGIIITLGAINISTKAPAKDNTAFYDLSREIDYESNKLIDYGVYKSKDPSAIGSSVLSFVANYSAANPDTDLLIVYGNKDNIQISLYDKTATGEISVGGAISQQSSRMPTVPQYEQEGSSLTVQLDSETNLTFELQPIGENFFIVLKKQAGEETLVAKE